ncbi:MAG TPA: hypothetical protein VGR67_16305 [Candidatus Polarisedimenticolia bacterium]|jgi:hypothetical protein|nr:hypothetical protein [Candidatus Polarisedimenticolia bacterium]
MPNSTAHRHQHLGILALSLVVAGAAFSGGADLYRSTPRLSGDAFVTQGTVQHPITLKILTARDGFVTRQVANGWPIALLLSSNNELGIGRAVVGPFFPIKGDTGYLMYADPDHCLSFVPQMECAGIDETYVEFTPDQDRPGVAHGTGNQERLAALTDSGGGGSPKIFLFNYATGLNDLLTPVGPPLGPGPDVIESHCLGSPFNSYPGPSCSGDADCSDGATCEQVPVNADGYGLGADDDLPGLVLLADTSIGVVFDQNFNPVAPRTARNLAGLLDSVAYQLNDASAQTSILAHLNVPPGQPATFVDSLGHVQSAPAPLGLFTPLVLMDRCVGAPFQEENGSGCEQSPRVRIDGGPIANLGDEEMIDALNAKVITLRAFVVNRTAPSSLADMNGDGIVGAKDATLAGYQLVSGEKTFQFRGWYESFEQAIPLFYDFDGNGDVIGTLVFPKGPGTVTQVPR